MNPDVIDTFISEYAERAETRIGGQEAALLRDALEAFLIDEWWLSNRPKDPLVQLALSLKSLKADPVALDAAIDDLCVAAHHHAAKVARYEKIIQIMRYELTMSNHFAPRRSD